MLLTLPVWFSLLAVVYCQLRESQVGPEAQQVRDSVTDLSKALPLATTFPQAVEAGLRYQLIYLQSMVLPTTLICYIIASSSQLRFAEGHGAVRKWREASGHCLQTVIVQ